jgi:hypothetical protein
MDRISPSSLRLVVLGLGGCAAVGLWMGLDGSLRRDAPDWTSGGPPPAAATSGPPEAKPYDPDSVKLTSPAPAPPAPKVAAKTEEPTEATPVETADITERPTATPAAKPSTPAAKTPPAKTPATKPAARPDPIGDLVQEKTAPADPQPEVPF